MGELKTLLALAIGDEDAIREGCDWIRHFEQLNPDRRRVYACIETLLKLGDCRALSQVRYSSSMAPRHCNRRKPCSAGKNASSACRRRA